MMLHRYVVADSPEWAAANPMNVNWSFVDRADAEEWLAVCQGDKRLKNGAVFEVHVTVKKVV